MTTLIDGQEVEFFSASGLVGACITYLDTNGRVSRQRAAYGADRKEALEKLSNQVQRTSNINAWHGDSYAAYQIECDFENGN